MEPIKYEEVIEFPDFFFMPYYLRPEGSELRNAGRFFFFFLLFFRVCVANEQLGPFSCGNQGQSIQWVLFLLPQNACVGS